MTKNIAVLATICLALSNSAVSSGPQIDAHGGCRHNPALVASCFTVHGRLFISNGTPSMRIWRVGTKRILGVLPSEAEIVPAVVREYAKRNTNLYGDFEVCPFDNERPGSMQAVCVESAANLVAERYIDGKAAPQVFRIRR